MGDDWLSKCMARQSYYESRISAIPDVLSATRVRQIQSPLPIYFVLWQVVLVPGTQTWEADSSSRCASYFGFISSSDATRGAPEGLNLQSHAEQPKPRKLWPLIHFRLRGIATL